MHAMLTMRISKSAGKEDGAPCDVLNHFWKLRISVHVPELAQSKSPILGHLILMCLHVVVTIVHDDYMYLPGHGLWKLGHIQEVHYGWTRWCTSQCPCKRCSPRQTTHFVTGAIPTSLPIRVVGE